VREQNDHRRLRSQILCAEEKGEASCDDGTAKQNRPNDGRDNAFSDDQTRATRWVMVLG
jgi:hypothetical protein